MSRVIRSEGSGEAVQLRSRQNTKAQVLFSHFEALQALLGKDSPLSAYERLVALVIAKHTNSWTGMAGGNGRPGPGIMTLAKEAGISKNSVIRALHALEERGLVAITRPPRSPSGRLSNTYRLLLETGATQGPVPDGVTTSFPQRQESLTENLLETNTVVSSSADSDPKCAVSVPSTSKMKRGRKSGRDETGEAAQELVRHLNRELRDAVASGITSSDWPKTLRAAKSALDGGSLDELREAITWGVQDRWWCAKLAGKPYAVLRDVLGAWRAKDRISNRNGTVTPATQTTPEFNTDGPWA